jgi:hypothetical protein
METPMTILPFRKFIGLTMYFSGSKSVLNVLLMCILLEQSLNIDGTF